MSGEFYLVYLLHIEPLCSWEQEIWALVSPGCYLALQSMLQKEGIHPAPLGSIL